MSQTPDFKKFAAELVSPSELFEPRSGRARVGIPESLELLGSLAKLTQSSLVKSASVATPERPITNPINTPAQDEPSQSVNYETSRAEYRQALKDQDLATALAELQARRQSAPRNRARPIQSTLLRDNGFQPATVPQVSAQVKSSPLSKASQRRSDALPQPILRGSPKNP
jgi:hypothetical protein